MKFRVDFGCYNHGIVREIHADTREKVLELAFEMLPQLIASGALVASTPQDGDSDVVQMFGPSRAGLGDDIIWDFMNGWLE